MVVRDGLGGTGVDERGPEGRGFIFAGGLTLARGSGAEDGRWPQSHRAHRGRTEGRQFVVQTFQSAGEGVG